jgi:DNA-binding transcriptional LysR family regulator
MLTERVMFRMQKHDEHGVLMGEHVLRRSSRLLPDWEGAHLFLELIRRGSFRATADSLSLSLVTRHVDGVRPTAEGQRVFNLASQMEQISFELIQSCGRSERTLTGEVRLAITEGLGALWVGSKLIEFQRANPRLMVDMHCTMHTADVLRLETDISVQLTRPTAQDLRLVKLGRLHLVFLAAQSYLDTYGEPKCIADLAKHRIVMQTDDDPDRHELYDRLFPGIPPERLLAVRTNVSSVNYWSVARGAGIGMLPTYVYAVGAPIIPVSVPVHHNIDIWMTYHPGAARIPRVRRLIDWLIRAFSPKTFPWFRDEFIAPEEFRNEYHGRALKSPFDGLGEEVRRIG